MFLRFAVIWALKMGDFYLVHTVVSIIFFGLALAILLENLLNFY